MRQCFPPRLQWARLGALNFKGWQACSEEISLFYVSMLHRETILRNICCCVANLGPMVDTDQNRSNEIRTQSQY